MHVAQLWHYPVKSMQGSRVDRLDVGLSGPAGDRAWGLLDTETGKVLSAKRWAVLLTASAEQVPGGVHITLADGTAIDSADPDSDTRLSVWVGRPVHLVAAGPATDTAYEMTFDPPDDDAEYYDIPVPPGAFHDLSPIHLLSEATLAHGAGEHPDLDWDIRRFRPNVVVAGDLEPFAEDGWCGRDVTVGGAVIRPVQPTVRCAMPLRAQPGLARQAPLFHALSELHNNQFGVYVDVVSAGVVTVGDAVTPA